MARTIKIEECLLEVPYSWEYDNIPNYNEVRLLYGTEYEAAINKMATDSGYPNDDEVIAALKTYYASENHRKYMDDKLKEMS